MHLIEPYNFLPPCSPEEVTLVDLQQSRSQPDKFMQQRTLPDGGTNNSTLTSSQKVRKSKTATHITSFHHDQVATRNRNSIRTPSVPVYDLPIAIDRPQEFYKDSFSQMLVVQSQRNCCQQRRYIAVSIELNRLEEISYVTNRFSRFHIGT